MAMARSPQQEISIKFWHLRPLQPGAPHSGLGTQLEVMQQASPAGPVHVQPTEHPCARRRAYPRAGALDPVWRCHVRIVHALGGRLAAVCSSCRPHM